MPNPRIHISVRPETKLILEHMARVQKRTLSGVAGPLLDGIAPHLVRVAAFLEAASEAPKTAQDRILGILEGLEADLLSEEAKQVFEDGQKNEIADRLPES